MNLSKPFRLAIIFLLMLFTWQCADDKLSPDGTGSIEGKVLNEKDLSPIVNAEVTTHPPTHTVLTDSSGHFKMEEVKVGDYNVIATERDFFSSSTAVNVNLNATTHVIINLTEREEDLDLPGFTDNFYPENQQEDVPVSLSISWEAKDPADTVEYNLKLYKAGQPVTIYEKELTDTFAEVSGLKFSTTYLWQLSAENKAGKVYTDVRTFTTRSFPDDFVLYAKRVEDVSQIFVTDTVKENNIQLTHNNYHSWRPVANPQKTKIAFLSTKDINPQLYTMNLDGSNVTRLTNIPTGGYYNKGVGFSWLPNGEQLVFSSYNSLYVINHDGTGLTHLTSISEEKHFREVSWSPVDDKIVALALGVDRYDAGIILMDTDGSNKETLVSDLDGALENPVFSIDGQKILYTYDVSGFQSDEGRQLDARVFQYNRQTGETKDMSIHKPSGTNDLYPRYTDDGARILFVNTNNTLGSRRDLYMMHPDSTHTHHRTRLVTGVEMPGW